MNATTTGLIAQHANRQFDWHAWLDPLAAGLVMVCVVALMILFTHEYLEARASVAADEEANRGTHELQIHKSRPVSLELRPSQANKPATTAFPSPLTRCFSIGSDPASPINPVSTEPPEHDGSANNPQAIARPDASWQPGHARSARHEASPRIVSQSGEIYEAAPSIASHYEAAPSMASQRDGIQEVNIQD